MKFAVLIMLCVPVWFFAGMWPDTDDVILWSSVPALSAIAFRLWKARRVGLATVFGVLVLAYIGIQFFNSPRALLHDPTTGMWAHSAAPIVWLPSSFMTKMTGKVLKWFVPVVLSVVAFRSLMDRDEIRFVLKGLVVNGLLTIVVGFACEAISPSKVLLFVQTMEPSWGPFGYVNSAASYYLMMAGLSLYLGKRWALAFPIFMIGTYQTGCTFGGLLMLALVGFYLMELAMKNATFRLEAGRPVFLMTSIFAIIALWPMLGPKFMAAIDSRLWQWKSAVRILKDNPVFGCGQYGYSQLRHFYTDMDCLQRLTESGRGNLHNDLLQYLIEFGPIGFSFLAAMVIIMAVDAVSFDTRFITFALLCVLAQSLVDIPFRCPSVLVLWFSILASCRTLKERIKENETSEEICGRVCPV